VIQNFIFTMPSVCTRTISTRMMKLKPFDVTPEVLACAYFIDSIRLKLHLRRWNCECQYSRMHYVYYGTFYFTAVSALS